MGFLITIILIFSVLALCIVLPLVVLYKWLSKNGHKRLALSLATIIVLIVGYFLYRAFYPNEEFYKEDFKEETNLTFPLAAKFIAEDASYPDMQGSYWSIAVIELPKSEYYNLHNLVANTAGFCVDTTQAIMGNIHSIYPKYNHSNDAVIYAKCETMSYKIAFQKDEKTVILQHVPH